MITLNKIPFLNKIKGLDDIDLKASFHLHNSMVVKICVRYSKTSDSFEYWQAPHVKSFVREFSSTAKHTAIITVEQSKGSNIWFNFDNSTFQNEFVDTSEFHLTLANLIETIAEFKKFMDYT